MLNVQITSYEGAPQASPYAVALTPYKPICNPLLAQDCLALIAHLTSSVVYLDSLPYLKTLDTPTQQAYPAETSHANLSCRGQSIRKNNIAGSFL